MPAFGLGSLRRNFAAGLLVLIPAGATLWLVSALWKLLDDPLRRVFLAFADPRRLDGQPWLQSVVRFLREAGLDLSPLGHIHGLGLLLTLALLTLVGSLARSLAGRTAIHLAERLVARVPVIGSIHGALKQALEAAMNSSSGAFREAVLLECPRPGLWTVAFVTGTFFPKPEPGFPSAPPPEEHAYCLVPTTPFPTNGFMVISPRSRLIPLGIPVEEALKLVISGGLLSATVAKGILAGRKVDAVVIGHGGVENAGERD